MNELGDILAKDFEDRSVAELEYISLHKKELSPQQLQQLQDESNSEHINTSSAPKKEIESVIEVKNLGEGMIECIVATDSIDRHGEKLNIDGLNVKKYLKNPVVQWAHNYDMPPIGKATKLWKEGGKLLAKMQFATDANPFAKQIYDLITGGFINAVSIGFMPLEMDGNTYTKSEMVEFSVVPVPANAEALIQARKMGLDKDFWKPYNINSMSELEKILAKVEKDGLDSLTLNDIKHLKENLNDLTKKQINMLAPVLTDDPKEDEDKEEVKDEEVKEDSEVDKKIKELTEKLKTLEARDSIVIKNISGQASQTFNLNKNTETSKEMKFLYFARGLQSGNFTQYQNAVGKAAMNTNNETNVVVPPVEFMAEIQRLEEMYGAARPYADVKKSTSGAGVKYLLGDSDLNIYDTAEGGFKKSTKNTYQEKLLGWRKFAGILPITDELSEDSAVDLWADATNRFARAYAKQEDTLVFLEKKTSGNVNDGITHAPGTNVIHTDGATVQSVKWENLVDMIYGVPSPSGDTGRFYLNREMLSIIMKLQDDNKRPIWLPGYGDVSNGAPATILGRPYTFTLVLPSLADDTDDLPFIVYGDLKYVTIGERTQLELKMFDTGVVGDPDEVDQTVSPLNLMTQDIQALRAVKRTNSVVRFPKAFSVLVTSTHS